MTALSRITRQAPKPHPAWRTTVLQAGGAGRGRTRWAHDHLVPRPDATLCAAALALPVTGCAGGDGSGDGGTSAAAQARAIASASSSTSASASPTVLRPFPQVPSIAACRKALGSACYTPDLVRTAYGIDKLNASGLTGKGRTVVVYEEVVPDTLKRDREIFSKAMTLPAPDLTVDSYDPAGRIALFDARNKDMAATAVETTLDVQMVHMTAPDAKVVVTQIGLPASAYRNAPTSGTSPSDTSSSGSPSPGSRSSTTPEPARMADRQAVQGAVAGAELMLDGIAQSVRKHRPDAISISFGIDEYTAAGRRTGQPAGELGEFSSPLAQVVASGATLVASAGDSGAAPPIGPDGRR